jgi:UDP-N-acetylglucosamine 2-epimerase (non-hydrolysing)
LDLPEPDYNLDVGSKNHGEQTGEMLAGIEEILIAENIDIVLVQGDTNSVLAGAIATSKLDAELGHIEAGLRSFDREMPEEINRVVADHVADHCFAPTDEAGDLLRNEGIPEERIHVTGNTIVDAVFENRELATQRSEVLENLGLIGGGFVLMTAHRAENVDDPQRLANLFAGVDRVANTFDVPVVYPIHPRARERVDEFDLDVPDSVRLIEPLDFLDFLRLEDQAMVILTDSGGVQEEACILGTPCVTMRDSTERPETVEVGANVVAGTEPTAILEATEAMLKVDGKWSNPFGDGTAAEQILDVLEAKSRSDSSEIP